MPRLILYDHSWRAEQTMLKSLPVFLASPPRGGSGQDALVEMFYSEWFASTWLHEGAQFTIVATYARALVNLRRRIMNRRSLLQRKGDHHAQ
jgi:hypothetical protein